MLLTGHGIAQNHGRAIEIQRALGKTVVFQRFAGAGDRPFLGAVHGIHNPRRNRQVPLDGVPNELTHPTADLGIGLVGRARVGIVVERRVPSVRCDLADAVTAALDVFPERRCIRSIGQDGTYAHNRDRSIGGLFHVSTPVSSRQALAPVKVLYCYAATAVRFATRP